MSLQSGIQIRSPVADQLSEVKRSNIRALKLVISGEEVVLSTTVPIQSNWEDDYDQCVLPLLEDTSPCYVFYKLDSASETGHDWIFISWIPENATTAKKMLYASTTATIRRQFGDRLIKEELKSNSIHDVNFHGLQKHIESKLAPAPLTRAEREMADVIRDKPSGGFYSARQTVGSVALALTDDTVYNINCFAEGTLDYVQLAVDCATEQIATSYTGSNVTPETLIKHTPKNDARFHLYRFKYHVADQSLSAAFFIHSVSCDHSSLKSRMLYSMCKSTLISQLEREFGLRFARRLETDLMEEVTAAYLVDTLYPKWEETKPKFEKPRGPAGRRPRQQII